MNQWTLFLGIAISTPIMMTYAHHSISGVYDTTQQLTVEGTVTSFEFINPHPYITMEVQRLGDGVQQWRLEMDNRSELSSAGMTNETFQEGDRIVVTGSPARSESQRLYIRRLDRPADGFRYEQVGNSPRIRLTR